MHTFSETGSVPAFLAKLWRLVEDSETNDLISWSTDGRSFIIQNQAQFAKELLPLNYKHNNMASFIRQLNMYGFHKITSIDNGGLRFDKDEMEFTHPCFQKDHPYLLEHIKRKIATSKQQQLQAQQQAEDKSALKLEAVSRVLSEVKNMRGRQDTLDSRFQTMKQENEALWREIAILRQKHHKQQQIVNKLIQFLVTIVQPSRSGLGSMNNGSNKRRFQLMINDAPQQAKLKKSDYDDGGATIEELNEALEEVAYANQQELLSKQDKGKKHVVPIVTGQIVRTSRSAGDAGANTSTSSSASGSAVVGKSVKPPGGNSVGSVIFKKLNGVSVVRKEKSSPGDQTKGTRNSEIPEVSSPMSIPERSPYHRTATPSMSGGSSSRSTSSSVSGTGSGGGGGDGGGGLNFNGGNETIEEIFSTSPIPFRTGGGDGADGMRSSFAKVVKMERDQDQQQQQQQKITTRSRNASNRGGGSSSKVAGTPANLIQLIESTIDRDELENFVDGGEPLEEGYDDEEHGYLVDHVDEMDPAIVQLYNQDNDNEMLNTPMVIKEMEKQQQKQQQQQQQLQKQRQPAGGKGGESLLKGNGAAANRRNEGQLPAGQRAQGRSLLSAGTTGASSTAKAGGSGLKASTATAAPANAPLILTRGGKKLAMAKKQTITSNEQQQQQQQQPSQQEDASLAGPSGFTGTSTSPVGTGGLSFASGNGYIPASDVVPRDIFEDSNDPDGVVKNDSPMLSSGFNFVDGGYYNPNVNISQLKAGRQQQQQQQQQQGQAGQSNQHQQQQQSPPSGIQLLNGDGEEFDENSLDSSLLLNRQVANEIDQQQQQQQQQEQQEQQQQLSKFVSNDLDVSRLNTVAEYGQHIDTVQNDLESLKELLKGEGYQLDANALLGNACSTAPPFGRVYFPSCPFDLDTINKVRTDLFNNNEDMLGYDFPMNLPDMMTDDQQQLLHQQQQQHVQSLLQQQQQQQQQQHQSGGSSNSSDKSGSSSSPTPGGHISPVPSAHTQLMSYKLQGGGDFVGGGANNGGANGGLLGLGLQHGPGSNSSSRSSVSSNSSMHSNGNGNVNGGGGGGNGLIGPGGTLGIVSGDYIDLNELLNMDGHCGGNDEEHSLVA